MQRLTQTSGALPVALSIARRGASGGGGIVHLSIEVVSLEISRYLHLPLVSIVEEFLLVVKQLLTRLCRIFKVRTLQLDKDTYKLSYVSFRSKLQALETRRALSDGSQ